MSDTEIFKTIRDIAYTQAKLYYKSEETNPPTVIGRSVFMLIISVVMIQLTRSGVPEAKLNSLVGVPELIAIEMKAAGWNLEGLKVAFNMD